MANGIGRVGWRTLVSNITPSTLWNSIYSVYNADSVGSSSLKTSLYAAYNGESNANDSFGTNHGTAQGGLTYDVGKVGTAFKFNGTNALVSLPNNSLNFTGDFSFSLWMNRKAAVNSYIFSNFYNGSTPYGYYLYISNGTIRFLLGNGTSSPLCNISTALLGGNVWQLITITKTNNSVKMYVDGTLKNSATINGNVVYTTTHYPIIGASKYDSGSPVGFLENGCQIDAVNFWQKELTASEVSELYNSGNGSQYITDNFYKPTTNDALNTYNGTPQGGLTYDVGKVGTAFKFNGTNAYVSLPTSSFNNLTGDFSVSCWFKTNTVSGNQMIFSNFAYNGGRRKGFYIVLSSNTIGCWLANEPTYNQLFYTSAVVSINTWYHLSVTRESSVVKIYLNGTLLVTNTDGIPLEYVTTLPSIGAYTHGAPSPIFAYFNGQIDALNIWQKSLTQAEITELYNSGNGKQYPN